MCYAIWILSTENHQKGCQGLFSLSVCVLNMLIVLCSSMMLSKDAFCFQFQLTLMCRDGLPSLLDMPVDSPSMAWRWHHDQRVQGIDVLIISGYVNMVAIYIYSNLIALIFFPRRKAVILIKKTIRAALAEAGEGTVLVQCAGIHVLLHSWFSQYYLLAYPGRWCGWPSRMRSPSGAAGGTIYIYIIYEYVDIYIYLLVCDALESLEH